MIVGLHLFNQLLRSVLGAVLTYIEEYVTKLGTDLVTTNRGNTTIIVVKPLVLSLIAIKAISIVMTKVSISIVIAHSHKIISTVLGRILTLDLLSQVVINVEILEGGNQQAY